MRRSEIELASSRATAPMGHKMVGECIMCAMCTVRAMCTDQRRDCGRRRGLSLNLSKPSARLETLR